MFTSSCNTSSDRAGIVTGRRSPSELGGRLDLGGGTETGNDRVPAAVASVEIALSAPLLLALLVLNPVDERAREGEEEMAGKELYGCSINGCLFFRYNIKSPWVNVRDLAVSDRQHFKAYKATARNEKIRC